VVRVGALNLILISAAISALRWAGLANTLDPTYMAILQVLQCFTLAGNTASIMCHIGHRVDAANFTPCSQVNSLCSAAYSWQARPTRWHGPAGFLMMAAFAALAIPLVTYSVRLAKRR
jgi:MFS transporter, PPP family, 3-phenylpropionic acid transporter